MLAGHSMIQTPMASPHIGFRKAPVDRPQFRRGCLLPFVDWGTIHSGGYPPPVCVPDFFSLNCLRRSSLESNCSLAYNHV
jgi:hypothetical protein